MKFNKYLFLLLFAALVLFSCTFQQTETVYVNKTYVAPLSAGQFWAVNVNSMTYYVANATLRKTGTHCKIYVENTVYSLLTALQISNLDTLVTEFDTATSGIHDLINSKFGTESDVNGDTHVSIFILNIGNGVAGYFNPADLYAYDSTFCTNQQDILYLDSSLFKSSLFDFNTTVAHEFQHLVNYNQKVFVNGNSTGSQTWLTEGLSTAAEYEYIYNKNGNISGSRLTTYYIPSFTSDNAGLIYWQSYMQYYSDAFAFFQWLRIQSAGGDTVYKAIVDNSNIDVNAVVQTVNNASYKITGYGSTWADLYKSWLIANLFLDSSTIYGYKSDYLNTHLSLSIGSTYSSGTVYSFPPGEAMYFILPSTTAITQTGDVYYVGLDTSTKAIDTTSSYSGNYILCYNINSSPTGASTTINASVTGKVTTYEIMPVKKNDVKGVKDLILEHDHKGSFITKDGKKNRINRDEDSSR